RRRIDDWILPNRAGKGIFRAAACLRRIRRFDFHDCLPRCDRQVDRRFCPPTTYLASLTDCFALRPRKATLLTYAPSGVVPSKFRPGAGGRGTANHLLKRLSFFAIMPKTLL